MLIIWKEVSRSIWQTQQYSAVWKDTCVISESSRVMGDPVNSSSLVDIPKEHKTDLWLSMISSFGSVVGVYVRLPSKLWKPNSFIKQSVMWFTHKNNIVRGLVGVDNNIFVMEGRQVLSNIWVFKDWSRAGAHGPTEFVFNSNLYKRPQTLHSFGKSI